MTRKHLDLRREARANYLGWARSIARGGPRPPNGALLRQAAVLGATTPGQLLETLAEAAKQCPAIFEVEPEQERGDD